MNGWQNKPFFKDSDKNTNVATYWLLADRAYTKWPQLLYVERSLQIGHKWIELAAGLNACKLSTFCEPFCSESSVIVYVYMTCGILLDLGL